VNTFPRDGEQFGAPRGALFTIVAKCSRSWKVGWDLLQLRSITDHQWNFRGEFCANLNASPSGIAGKEIKRIRDNRLESWRLHPCFSLDYKASNAVDDFARTPAIRTNVGNYLSYFVRPQNSAVSPGRVLADAA
jgi:hypothetical protein